MEFQVITTLWAIVNGGLAVSATACFCDPVIASRLNGMVGYVLAGLALVSGIARTLYTFHIVEALNTLAEKSDKR